MGEKVVRAESEQRNAEGSSSKATKTTAEAGGGRAGGGRGADREAKAKEQSEVISGISSVDQGEPLKIPIDDVSEEERKKEEKNARRRELYAKKKAENGGTVKSRKSRKKKDDTPDTAQLNLLISSISGLVASRPGYEHWLLTEKEIQSITEPLSRIIAENENLKAVSEHTDAIALVMACITVFLPRIIITTNQQREKKKDERSKQFIGEQKGKIEKSGLRNVGGTTTANRKHESSLSFLGSPVN